ncbi:LanC-like protein gcl2 [Castilleja foliolosa]|uniref:LanC-like protein gcl2 n=1 Tax=Castilleja foliolosa TaxID=1961234 RepID=A0ABD3CSL1_9LAMI
MADRYFPNEMPDFVQESPNVAEEGPDIQPRATQASLIRLLQLPYSNLSSKFQHAALDLKETIVLETWGLTKQRVDNFTLYWGTMGTAFLLFKSFQLTGNKNDLSLCSEIVRACDSASVQSRDVTFLCGRGGVCALGAVVAKYMNDDKLLQYYFAQFKEIRLSDDHPNELLYGRTGYLWSCLFLNKHLGNKTISLTSLSGIVRGVIENGRTLGKSGASPLMFEFNGERYWGAAHGLAGIMRVLMEFELAPDELEDVKGTLKYMIKNRFPSGNYPASEADKQRDVLVQWCRGAPGIALTLVKAAEVFGDKEFLEAAMEAAEVVWNRGLLKRVGMCHGISGNAYVFLALYRLTGIVEYLYRAKAFACFLLDGATMLMTTGELHGGDAEFSLFEGIGGMAHLFLDMVEPKNARFPAFEL